MSLLLLLVSLPTLYWPGGVESAAALKAAGIERLAVPVEQAEAWRKAGFDVAPVSAEDLAAREKVEAPGLAVEITLASATRNPWVSASGWIFQRKSAGRYYYNELPAGRAVLAGAEAYAYGADALLKIDPTDVGAFGGLLAFLKDLPPRELPAVADLGVVDDGSDDVGEVMNLLARRNLLFEPLVKPSPKFRINVELGTAEYPKEDAGDPSEFAAKVRRQLTDEARTLRVYGSDVVIGRVSGDGSHARVHVLNYGGRPIETLRVRLRGAWGRGEGYVAGRGKVALEDYAMEGGVTEFTLTAVGVYVIADLPAIH